jgi:hypothetical protein
VVDLIREGFVQRDGLDREHRDVIFLAEVAGGLAPIPNKPEEL